MDKEVKNKLQNLSNEKKLCRSSQQTVREIVTMLICFYRIYGIYADGATVNQSGGVINVKKHSSSATSYNIYGKNGAQINNNGGEIIAYVPIYNGHV
jgi:hypothetical protein